MANRLWFGVMAVAVLFGGCAVAALSSQEKDYAAAALGWGLSGHTTSAPTPNIPNLIPQRQQSPEKKAAPSSSQENNISQTSQQCGPGGCFRSTPPSSSSKASSSTFRYSPPARSGPVRRLLGRIFCRGCR